MSKVEWIRRKKIKKWGEEWQVGHLIIAGASLLIVAGVFLIYSPIFKEREEIFNPKPGESSLKPEEKQDLILRMSAPSVRAQLSDDSNAQLETSKFKNPKPSPPSSLSDSERKKLIESMSAPQR